ncbi:MAG: ATP-grasp domain-containing protein [Candidatus Levybacteria bacterium]|nr:ATP-grasp domain-containing protein [Candidatus Levybacteria bacterium]
MKPIVLIIGTEIPQLKKLSDTFSFIYRPADISLSPEKLTRLLVKEIKKKYPEVQAVLGTLDYPSIIAAMVAKELGLPGPTPRSIFLAQNKALFTPLAGKHHTYFPKTEILNIKKGKPSISYPVFIRPIKGSFSAFSYKIDSEKEFSEIRKTILKTKRDIKQFERFFQMFDKKIKNLKDWYIVQEYINFKQYTLDGFTQDNKLSILGITESIYTPDRKSFKRFDFPSKIPDKSYKKLQKILNGVLSEMKYSEGCFNLEFFILPDGNISMIELNTRISPGFANLYSQVYKTPLLKIAIDVARGNHPDLTMLEKPRYASSFPLRVIGDHLVQKVPSDDEIEKLKIKFDILSIKIDFKVGMKLSDKQQDAYSFRYGIVDIAGKSHGEILRKFSDLVKNLNVQLKPIKK